MDWIMRTLSNMVEIEHRDEEKKDQLTITTDVGSMPEETDIKAINISSKYEGVLAPEDLLPDILPHTPQLRRLSSFIRMTWRGLCSLNLEGIEELEVHLEGPITEEKLSISTLKRLILFADRGVTNNQSIDFSGIKQLECLSLSYLKGQDLQQISSLEGLKRLALREIGIKDLNWLNGAKYKLKSLNIGDNVEDCKGIFSQNDIERLTILYSSISDLTPIVNAPKLSYVDLRYGNITNDRCLRESHIEKVLVTDEDSKREWIDREVRELSVQAARFLCGRKQQFRKWNELSQSQQRYLVYISGKSFEFQIEHLIRSIFDDTIKRVKTGKKRMMYKITTDEFIHSFSQQCYKEFPFLKAVNS